MARARIEAVDALEVVDCRLDPTLRVRVRTADGTAVSADVPRGRSTGVHEAVDLRDGDHRYGGLGVRTAVANVTDVIQPELIGRDATDQRAVDEALLDLDGTADKSNLGGNALTGVSLAVLKAGAAASGEPLYRYVGDADGSVLPVPLFDVIEGGALAATDLDFQEHQVVPTGAESFAEALRRCAEVYAELGDHLAERYGEASRNVGVEGGYTPPGMTDPREAFDAASHVIDELGYTDQFGLGLDVAASQFYDETADRYRLQGQARSREALFELYEDLVASYPVITIEDPLHEEDFAGFAELTDRLPVQIVGDDLFATDPARLAQGIDAGAATALLWKVNQVGTVTEALDAAALARANGYAVQVSERSGQTADTWLADLAVGLEAGQIKTGVTRAERTDQYNRLLEIEAELGGDGSYARWP